MEKTNSSVLPLVSKGERNSVIVIVRVIAMLMIIGCHLSSWLGINILGMILNVGVYVFLLISGMLYSKKQIAEGFIFIKKRWVKLCIPMYYLVVFLVVFNVLNSEIGVLKSIPTYLFNLQGIGFIILGIDLYQMNGLGHLWFLTAIMICYLLLIAVKKIETAGFWNSKIRFSFTWVLLLFADVLFAYIIRVQLHYFIAFFMGYAIGDRVNRLSREKYIVATLAMACAMAARLLVRKYADGTILYNDLVVPFTHIVLALWIYGTIQFISQKAPNVIKSFAESKLMNWLEKLSMYLYMTHYMFLAGPFYISSLTSSKPIQILIFLPEHWQVRSLCNISLRKRSTG